MGFSALMWVLCIMQIVRWIGHSGALDGIAGGTTQPVRGCVGTQCYEVFSCYGMRDATFHLREPLASVSGLWFFAWGFHGAYRGVRSQVQWLGVYLLISASLHLVLVIWDIAYKEGCDAYPVNLVYAALLPRFPSPPITTAAQNMLRSTTDYSVAVVDQITGGFNALAWYVVVGLVWVAILAYGGFEAYTLADLVERGPLGLGVHYGLDRWDEVINYDAVRRHKGKQMRSQFSEDCNVNIDQDMEVPFGYKLPTAKGYGAAYPVGSFEHMPLMQQNAAEFAGFAGAGQKLAEPEEPPIFEGDWFAGFDSRDYAAENEAQEAMLYKEAEEPREQTSWIGSYFEEDQEPRPSQEAAQTWAAPGVEAGPRPVTVFQSV